MTDNAEPTPGPVRTAQSINNGMVYVVPHDRPNHSVALCDTEETAAFIASIYNAVQSLAQTLDVPAVALAEELERGGLMSLTGAGGRMEDDHMTSEAHHPNHVLVPKEAFDEMIAILDRLRSAGKAGGEG